MRHRLLAVLAVVAIMFFSIFPDCFFSIAAAESGHISVVVEKEGTLAIEILKQIEQWSEVEELSVRGPLSLSDMEHFSQMTCLRILNLSEAAIDVISGCQGLSNLESVILPETVTQVAPRGFNNCQKLSIVNLDNVAKIGEYAFYNCYALEKINLANLLMLESNAFANCSSLRSVELASLSNLGYAAFEGCQSLINVTLPDYIDTIAGSVFSGCVSLTSIKFPKKCRRIEDYAFSDSGITNVDFPAGLEYLGRRAFSNVSLKNIILPSSVRYIGYCCFEKRYNSGDGFSEVTCLAVTPPVMENAFSDINSLSLNVPALSVTQYKMDSNWALFKEILPMDEMVGEIDVVSDMTITSLDGIAENANVTISSYFDDNSGMSSSGHLYINASEALHIGQLKMHQYMGNTEKCTTLITDGSVTADKVVMTLNLVPNQWNFISFPFDVKVGDIVMPEGVLWVVRKYSGENRAAMLGDTWINMSASSVLRAGVGYIVHCTDSNSDEWDTSEVQMTVTAVDNDMKNRIFNNSNESVSLENHPSEFAHNRSWNLMGNPYPAFYDIRCLDFEAPLTVWNGFGYEVYSPLDDNYKLQPGEAFFVQRPDEKDVIVFNCDGRSSKASISENSSRAPRKTGVGNRAIDRKVYNLFMSDESYTDRVRCVINPNASAEYESGRDACKFLSPNSQMSQIYIVNGEVKYSIDERPHIGECHLGIYADSDKEFRICLDTKDRTTDVILIDDMTGIKVNLMENEYIFDAKQGYDDNRFRIRFVEKGSGVKSRPEDYVEDSPAYNLNGVRVGSNSKGIVIRNGNKTLE